MNGVGCSEIKNKLHHQEIFQPETFLNVESPNIPPYAVLVLNRCINFPVEFIIPFWNKASIRVTVDGGTNRWFTFLENNQISSSDVATADIVCGDFDSISENILRKAQQDVNIKGYFQVVHTPDQDETDFTKAVMLLSTYCQEKDIRLDSVAVICQQSGRIDQIMGNINTLHKYTIHSWMNATLYILSDDSISWLLNKGLSIIHIPECLLVSKNTWCALMPVGSKATVTSTGLKWNLDDRVMEFGGLMSTSNRFESSQTVTVETDSFLLWSMNIIPLMSKLYGIADEDSS